MRDRKLDNLEAEVDKEMKVVNLIDFDELDWMSEGKSEDTFGLFFEIDLIDFGYDEGESVKCSDVKREAIEEADGETFGLSRQISDAVGANGIDKVEQCCQVRAMDALGAPSNVDVVLGMEEMVKDLLKALRNDD